MKIINGLVKCMEALISEVKSDKKMRKFVVYGTLAAIFLCLPFLILSAILMIATILKNVPMWIILAFIVAIYYGKKLCKK